MVVIVAPMPEDSAPFYADGLRFECTQCGNCCTGPPGYVWFAEREAAAMAAHLGVDVSRFRREHAHVAHGRWTLNERWNQDVEGYDCIFLRRDPDSGKALCGIYSVRPTQCRTWPFWPQNLRNTRAWQAATQNCPGMNSGKLVPLEQIRILRDRTPNA